MTTGSIQKIRALEHQWGRCLTAASKRVKLRAQAETTSPNSPMQLRAIVLKEDPQYGGGGHPANRGHSGLLVPGDPNGRGLPRRLDIDTGQRWRWENPQEALKEALGLVKRKMTLK